MVRKIIILLFLFCIPLFAGAEVEIFLDQSGTLEYTRDFWTSDQNPNSGASQFLARYEYAREQYPQGYQLSMQELRSLIFSLYEGTPEEANSLDLYNEFLDFEEQNFKDYIGIAISPDTETHISEKVAAGFKLTPFESRFRNCGLSLSQRRNVVKGLLVWIRGHQNRSVDQIQYSNPKFGDCIVPFPDMRRNPQQITALGNTTFPSNLYIAEVRKGNFLNFGARENNQNVLSGLVLPGNISSPKEFSSTRIDTNTRIIKEAGKNRLMLIHQNGYINPFVNKKIRKVGNTFQIAGTNFLPQNAHISGILFVSASDSLQKRMLGNWEQVQDGIYKKTVIQSNTYSRNASGVYIPSQRVAVTHYYAVTYNYDISAPECKNTFFSHENEGADTFTLSNNSWFRSPKYGYFECKDLESGCLCDTSQTGCFLRDDTVFSLPSMVPHNNTFQYTFLNSAQIPQNCDSSSTPKILYDFQSPDIQLSIQGNPQNSLQKEYVSNQGEFYDGVQISQKRLYNIQNDFSYEASNMLDMKIRIFDPAAQIGEGVSGIASYNLEVSERIGSDWNQRIQTEQVFSSPPLSTQVDFTNIPQFASISQKAGEYQVLLRIYDRAGNESRIIWYFTITPGPIDASKSILSSSQKNTLFADNVLFYTYSLQLLDRYDNPIPGKSFSQVSHSCNGIQDCKEIRTNMLTSIPSGAGALRVNPVSGQSDDQGRVHFRVSSLAPGIFHESFQFSFTDPNQNIVFRAGENSFLKPFTGVLEVRENTSWVSDFLPIDTSSYFRVRIENQSSLSLTPSIGDFSSFLVGRHPDTSFTLSGGSMKNISHGRQFRGTFESTLSSEESHKTLLEIIDGERSGVSISYNLSGENIVYRLSPDTFSENPLILQNTRELENPVKVIGFLQGVGNETNATERQNISELNSTDMRNDFRKNVLSTVKNMPSETVTGNIYYIDKTNEADSSVVLGNLPIDTFETLVVRNGNIIVNENLTNDGGSTPVGIVSILDDVYFVDGGYNDVGNIYIEADVNLIQAIMYTDGAIISSENGSPISMNTGNRDETLEKQLKVFGSVFSRNTLSGGREYSGTYMLPGGKTSNDENLARQYDFYYLRRGSEGCERDQYDFCNIPHYFILEYDTRVLSDPPTLFEN